MSAGGNKNTTSENGGESHHATPRTIRADELIPVASDNHRSVIQRSEDDKDRSASRWAGMVAVGIALLFAVGILAVGRPDAATADKAWNLLFTIVGAATAYIFQTNRPKN
jgi:hypothetical protein